MNWIWYMLIGISIGWVTKIPFLLKYYKEIKETEKRIHRIAKDIIEKL